MTTERQYPLCKVCGHRARHLITNVPRCDECGGPCMTPEGRAREDSYPKPWDPRPPRS